MGILKTINNIQIKIKMPYPSQKPAVFSKAKDTKSKPLISSTLQNPNQDVCWTFIIIVAKIWNNDTSNISDQIMIKMLTPKPEFKLWLDF